MRPSFFASSSWLLCVSFQYLSDLSRLSRSPELPIATKLFILIPSSPCFMYPWALCDDFLLLFKRFRMRPAKEGPHPIMTATVEISEIVFLENRAKGRRTDAAFKYCPQWHELRIVWLFRFSITCTLPIDIELYDPESREYYTDNAAAKENENSQFLESRQLKVICKADWQSHNCQMLALLATANIRKSHALARSVATSKEYPSHTLRTILVYSFTVP